MIQNSRAPTPVTILIADDHELVRRGVRRHLEGIAGFTVVGEADNGTRAVEMAAEISPDVLITDLRMPGADGVKVTRQARENHPTIKIIVLSMYTSAAYVYAALMAGASGYVSKASDIQNLEDIIRRVLDGERYLSPPITESSLRAYCIRSCKPLLP